MSVVTTEEHCEENFNEVKNTFRPSRSYTSVKEVEVLWFWAEKAVSWKPTSEGPHPMRFEDFRNRRRRYAGTVKRALRIRFENNSDIGAFVRLTNSYCLIGTQESSENFLNTVKGDLRQIPVIGTSLAGCRVIGRLCVGNKNGLLLPESVYDTELQQIKTELPDSVKVERIEERLSALGNVIACNDRVALVHPDLNKESEEIIADTLQVEVFRHLIANNPLVGSYCVLNNSGGLVCPGVSNRELENLSSLLEVPLTRGTVNYGSRVIGVGLAVNDSIAYAGMKTTCSEFSVIEPIFKMNKPYI